LLSAITLGRKEGLELAAALITGESTDSGRRQRLKQMPRLPRGAGHAQAKARSPTGDTTSSSVPSI
jgi:hypothetical protein